MTASGSTHDRTPAHARRRGAKPTQHHHLAIGIRFMQILAIQSAELILLARPDMQARDLIDNKQQDDADDEAPQRARACRGELVAHLLPVVVPPAALVGVEDAVEGGDEFCGEEARHDVADEAADAVDGEDVEPVVGADVVLVLDGEEGAHGGQGADEAGHVDGHEARRGRDADQPADDAGAEADDAELLAEEILEQDPGDAAAAGGEVRVDDDVDGADGEVGRGGA